MRETDHIHAFARVCLSECRELLDAGVSAPQVARRMARQWPAGLVRWAIETLRVDQGHIRSFG